MNTNSIFKKKGPAKRIVLYPNLKKGHIEKDNYFVSVLNEDYTVIKNDTRLDGREKFRKAREENPDAFIPLTIRACLEVVIWAANDRFWNLTLPFFRPMAPL